jgi:hypothetical protein
LRPFGRGAAVRTAALASNRRIRHRVVAASGVALGIFAVAPEIAAATARKHRATSTPAPSREPRSG